MIRLTTIAATVLLFFAGCGAGRLYDPYAMPITKSRMFEAERGVPLAQPLPAPSGCTAESSARTFQCKIIHSHSGRKLLEFDEVRTIPVSVRIQCVDGETFFISIYNYGKGECHQRVLLEDGRSVTRYLDKLYPY